VPSAFAVLKVNFSFCSSQKSLRLKVYSLGTGTQRRDAYQSQQGMMKNDKSKYEARKMNIQRIKYRNEKDMSILRREKE